jgi:hypothetical protein
LRSANANRADVAIGVDRDALPSMTNGQLMRIAECDIVTMHGWTHLGRELPEAAVQKLLAYYASKVSKSTDSKRNA